LSIPTRRSSDLHIDVKIQNRNIGYLFQDYQLFPHMNVFQNITVMAEPSDHIDTLITQLNIEHLKTKFPIRLSGGESQRVSLARTIITKTDLILLELILLYSIYIICY